MSRSHVSSNRSPARTSRPGSIARVNASRSSRRGAIYAVFRAIAEDRTPDPDDLVLLGELHAAAVARARLVPAGDGYALAWDGEVLGPLDRLKLCDACPWLFLDTSRNHSRRWCSMNECGARSKMRRYRARQRTREGIPSSRATSSA